MLNNQFDKQLKITAKVYKLIKTNPNGKAFLPADIPAPWPPNRLEDSKEFMGHQTRPCSGQPDDQKPRRN
jgi:hypothetical protein